jgi:hypothetical protein
MMTSHSDPGDQERGTRRKPHRAAPLPAPGQNDLFRDTQPPKSPSEGEQRKEKALEKHEKSSRAPLIRYLRTELRALIRKRESLAGALRQFNDSTGTIDGKAFVTADDAVRILKESKVVPHTEDGEEEPRNWLGALFREPGWVFTGKTVPSLRPEANGRHVRAWRWEGA